MKARALGRVMDDLAELTWFKLVEARRLEMRMGEVSITDHNLLALQQFASAAGSDVRLVHAHDEATSGADFEIWLVDRAGVPVWAYSIQAKVGGWVGKTYKYRALGHKVSGAAQHDLLIQHAAKHKTRPFHLLYNGWETGDPGAPASSHPGHQKLGCAAISTFEVARIRRGKRPSLKAVDYLPMSFPWSELVTKLNPPTAATAPSSVPEAPPGSAGSAGSPGSPGGPSSGDGRGGGGGADGDGRGPQGGAADADSDSPARPPATDAGLDAVRGNLANAEGELASPLARPTTLPDYVRRGLDGPRIQIPRRRADNVWVPEFAVVVTVD
jgi:hypothetical protein